MVAPFARATTNKIALVCASAYLCCENKKQDGSAKLPSFCFTIDLASTMLYNCDRLARAVRTIYKEVSKLC